MKRTKMIQKAIVSVGLFGFILASSAAMGADGTHAKRRYSGEQWESTPAPKVIYVEITGSRIPQRVVLHGQQVNSGSPLYVIGGNELLRSGATSINGLLAMDPSITFSRRR
jgi:hypothetical protein